MAEAEAKPPCRGTGQAPPQDISRLSFWKALLVYPALVTAVLGALPTACQAIRAWRLDTTYEKVQLAEEQRALWERNLDCLEAKPVYEVDVNAEVTVGVTLCPSGDALLRYAVDDELTYTWVRFPGWRHVKPQTRWDPHESVQGVHEAFLAQVRLAWGTWRCVRVTGTAVHRLVQRAQDDCVWEERRVTTGQLVARLKAACDAPCPADATPPARRGPPPLGRKWKGASGKVKGENRKSDLCTFAFALSPCGRRCLWTRNRAVCPPSQPYCGKPCPSACCWSAGLAARRWTGRSRWGSWSS